MMWKQHTAHRFDPIKCFPIEIVELIFSFVVYHVEELEPESPWSEWRWTIPASEIIAGYRGAPLILASVCRAWYQIATTYPRLWSIIIIDQSEDDYLTRLQLFLDRSGREPLEVILLDHETPTLRLNEFLMEHAHRFKTLVGLPARPTFTPSRIESLKASTSFMNWSEYTSTGHRVSSFPVPKCLRHAQLHQWNFDSRSLIQFTYFHILESISISISPDPKDTQWDQKLRFERLRHFRIHISNADQPTRSSSYSSWIEWLECPALVDLDFVYRLKRYSPNELYRRLEACLLRFRSLRNLRVHMGYSDPISYQFDDSELKNMQPPAFERSLDLVQLMLYGSEVSENAGIGAFTERIFSVFVPNTHLAWPYGRFPSPTIFTNLKSMHIGYYVEGDWSSLVATERTDLTFPFLEELYLQKAEPKWINLLRAPRLTSLRIDGFIPSDLRHIKESTISSIRLQFEESVRGSREIHLPTANRLHLELNNKDIFCVNLHPSPVQSVAMEHTHWEKETLCPPNWTADYVSKVLGMVTDLKVNHQHGGGDGLQYPSQNILSFLQPFVHLKNLTLLWGKTGESTCIDQLAQHFVDPNFLPELRSLSITEYPSWPNFFQNIQQRQVGFLSGQFRTALKEITIRGRVHGVLLEHLRESLAGTYISLLNLPPCRLGSKEWPAQPFKYQELDTDGLLCCYICHKAGLEMGCTVSPCKDASEMLICDRNSKYFDDWEVNTVFAP